MSPIEPATPAVDDQADYDDVQVIVPGRTWTQILQDRRAAAIAAGVAADPTPGEAPAPPEPAVDTVPIPPVGSPDRPAAVIAGPPAAAPATAGVDVDAIAAQVVDRVLAALEAADAAKSADPAPSAPDTPPVASGAAPGPLAPPERTQG